MVRRSAQAQKVQLAIECLHPPAELHEGRPVAFGLLDRQGALQAGQPLGGGGLRFSCEAEATVLESGADWRGAYVHGPRGERFLYLAWREVGAQAWIRRSKIMLADIPPHHLDPVAHSMRTLVLEVLDISRARAQFVSRWRDA
jgi:hypothetical protein